MKNFKFTFFLVIFLSLYGISFAQTTLYTQNFGTGGTALPTGWSQTGGTTGWYISATSPSNTYTGASGGNGVRSGGVTTPDTLNFSGVGTTGYTNITVLWGERRSTGATFSAVFHG